MKFGGNAAEERRFLVDDGTSDVTCGIGVGAGVGVGRRRSCGGVGGLWQAEDEKRVRR